MSTSGVKSALREVANDTFQTIKDCIQVEKELAQARESGNIAVIPAAVKTILAGMQQKHKEMYAKLKKAESEIIEEQVA